MRKKILSVVLPALLLLVSVYMGFNGVFLARLGSGQSQRVALLVVTNAVGMAMLFTAFLGAVAAALLFLRKGVRGARVLLFIVMAMAIACAALCIYIRLAPFSGAMFPLLGLPLTAHLLCAGGCLWNAWPSPKAAAPQQSEDE